MAFLDDVHAKRKPLADVLSTNPGIRKLFVEQLYPDRAHFIYELLQNAESAFATQAQFTLDDNSMSFQHNGRPFNEDDVWSITTIGESARKERDSASDLRRSLPTPRLHTSGPPPFPSQSRTLFCQRQFLSGENLNCGLDLSSV